MTDSPSGFDNPFRPAAAQPAPEADGGHLAEEPEQPTAPIVQTTELFPDPAAARRRERRGLLLPVVVAAVVAALLGGGIGAGVALAVAPQSSDSGASTGSNVVINDPSNASVVAAVTAKAAPSVVTISVTSSTESGTGSGIVLTSDGDVLTNNHVVTLEGKVSSATITVSLANGHVYPASIVGTDPVNDLAVLKLKGASGLTPITFGNSAKLNVGDPVVVIGAPLDLPNTVTSGIISARGRSIAVASSAVTSGSSGTDPFGDGSTDTAAPNIYLSVLQTDAAINPGNSGGAMLDADGKLVGVVVALAGTGSTSSDTQSGSIGVGFAIPSVVAQRIADDLVAGKKVTHGQLGVSSPSEDTTTTGTVSGVTVSKVTSGSAAAKAGIRAGDVITDVDGVQVQDYTDLAAQVRAQPGGAKVTVTYVRGGTTTTVDVTLGTLAATS